jgi:hypothetical protein
MSHIILRNPWTKKEVFIDENIVTDQHINFMDDMMNPMAKDLVLKKLPNAHPGEFFRLFTDIVGSREAGIIWFLADEEAGLSGYSKSENKSLSVFGSATNF